MATVQLSETPVPSHVDPALIWGHNLNDYAADLDDPFVSLARIHEDKREVVWGEGMSLNLSGWLPFQVNKVALWLVQPPMICGTKAAIHFKCRAGPEGQR